MINHKPLAGSDVEDVLRDMYYATIKQGNTEAHHVMFNGVRVVMFKENYNR